MSSDPIAERVIGAERTLVALALYDREAAPALVDALGVGQVRDDAARAVWEALRASWDERGYASELDLINRGLSPDQIRPVKNLAAAARATSPEDALEAVRGVHALDDVRNVCNAAAANCREHDAGAVPVRGMVSDIVTALELTLERLTAAEQEVDARVAARRWFEAQLDTGSSWRATWGVKELDDRLGGIQPGTLHVPIGLPAHGKSALACTASWATAAAGKRVLYVSREMREEEMGARFAAISTNKTMKHMVSKAWDGVDPEGYIETIPEGIVPDCRSRDIASVRAKLRMAQSQGRPYHLVVLDYLQLFNGVGDAQHERIGSIAYGAKDMAMDLDVAVIALAQVNRQNDGTTAPTMREIRGSSAIEDAADSVVSIFKAKDAYKEATTGRFAYQYDLSIEKARNAESGQLEPHELSAGTFRVRRKSEFTDAQESDLQSKGAFREGVPN